MDSKLYINPPLVDRAYHWEGKRQPRTRKDLDAFFKSARLPSFCRVQVSDNP